MNVNKAHMREWRDALREAHKRGTPQTTGVLNRSASGGSLRNRPVGFCCMGIWCEVAVTAGRLSTDVIPDVEITYYKDPVSEHIDSAEMPESEIEYLGLSRTDPILFSAVDHGLDREGNALHYSASQLNDSQRLNFDQIADCMTWTYSLDEEDA